jgi:shikimate kinase
VTSSSPVLALVGFMGSGKTTVGRLLARSLAVPFADLDALVEEESGLAVRDWFARRGEPAFRVAERDVLLRACAAHAAGGGVIALGGGAFAVDETRAVLAGRARTIWLDAPLADIAARVTDDGSRPLFRDAASVARLFAERSAAYALADVRVDAGGTAEEVVARIRSAIGAG